MAVLKSSQIVNLALETALLAIALALEEFHELGTELLDNLRISAQHQVSLGTAARGNALGNGQEVEDTLGSHPQECVDEVHLDAISSMEGEVLGTLLLRQIFQSFGLGGGKVLKQLLEVLPIALHILLQLLDKLQVLAGTTSGNQGDID